MVLGCRAGISLHVGLPSFPAALVAVTIPKARRARILEDTRKFKISVPERDGAVSAHVDRVERGEPYRK